jgi:GNAT superfamily N-acetyltransferase
LIRIDAVGFSRSDRVRFINVEFALNRHDPLWVPPLRIDRMKYLNPKKNPFFLHADVQHFVAVKDGKDVGRVAAIRNRAHEEVHQEPVGFFGFFESIDDSEVAGGLLDAAADWLREQGLETIRGPLSYDTNEVTGMLVEPFDSSPMVMMAYNREYLPRLVTGAGFTKAKDLLAYTLVSNALPDRIARLSDRVKKREGIELRRLDMKRFLDEVHTVRDIYNQAWEKNWGFVPMTSEEIDHKAADLKQVLDPDFVYFADVEGETVGFAMALPDVNQAVRPVRSGRLFPFGLFRIMRAWKKISAVRVVILGTIPEYRNRGLEVLFYRELFDAAFRRGMTHGECSWILEDNEPMVKGIAALGATEPSKRYRIYDRTL